MISETWTYASANSVTYAGDLTGIYSAGMRVRLTQGTVKYFVIVSVVYSSPNTTITFYGGGIYSLTSDPITSHDATAAAIPQGFPTALLRASATLDGFCPVLPNNTAKFLRGDGSWETPAGNVTNGDSHDHVGGDGAQIDHGDLAGLGDDDHTQYIKHSLATAINDFLVASGNGAYIKKTLAEVKTILGLGSAAYTASGDYAAAAKGVTNGDSHDHNGGDGAQVDHGGLAGLGDDDHTQYIKHSLATAGNDFLVASGSGAFVKKTLAETQAILASWYSAADETWTYASADAPTFTFTTPGDKTNKYWPGVRILILQSSYKFFIVTKVVYSAPNTTITIYGGTDNLLANSAISSNYYSYMKAPGNFPLDPQKWTVKFTDTTQRTQATPTDSTYYNIGGQSISVPIGIWRLRLHVYATSGGVTSPSYHVLYAALSTSTSSVSDAVLWCSSVGIGVGTVSITAELRNVVTLAAKTVYYPIMSRVCDKTGGVLYFYNDINAMVIEAECAYL